jgi:hypothetical protein
LDCFVCFNCFFDEGQGDAGGGANAGGTFFVAGGDGAGDSANGGGDRLLLQLSGVVFGGAQM